VQKKLGIIVDKEEIIRQLMRYANNIPHYSLIQRWSEHSGELLD
jgi:hypothetical protein